MKRIVYILAIAALVATSFWFGVGVGAQTTNEFRAAQTKTTPSCRVECWDDGTVVIRTNQENVNEWRDYIVIRRK